MSQPRGRHPNNNNRNNNNNNKSWIPFVLNSCVILSVGYGAFYVYTHYMKPKQPSLQNDDNDDVEQFPLYNPTPLGDFDDTDDTNPNTTTFYTGGDGQKMDVRQEYISTLLQQRRFSSVLSNPYLNHDKVEYYFHLGFDSSSPILSRFNRIKWVIIVRSKSDVKLVAQRILSEFPQFAEEKDGNELPKPIGSTDRFFMLQIASILIVSCGIGAPSISILLQEITKVLVDSGAFSPNENNTALTYQTSYVEYILLISAPGIKTAPSAKVYKRRHSLSNILDSDNNKLRRTSSGSTTPRGTTHSKLSGLSALRVDLKAQRRQSLEVGNASSDNLLDNDDEKRPSQITQGEVPVITPTSCYSETLSNYRDITSCGEITRRQMKFDRNLISDIKIRCSFLRSLKPKMGKGLSVKYLHEALSHNSVAINQDNNIKSKFIQNCIDQNIKYVDMESGYFAAFCNTLNISCVAIVGIEYDIAAPSKTNNNMRVSHNTALQATLDVFCQYLWDRISQDIQSMDRGQSQSINNNKNKNNNDSGVIYDDKIDIGSMDRSSSFTGPPTNTKNVLRPKQRNNAKAVDDNNNNNNNHHNAAPPAAFSDNCNLNDLQKNENEGS